MKNKVIRDYISSEDLLEKLGYRVFKSGIRVGKITKNSKGITIHCGEGSDYKPISWLELQLNKFMKKKGNKNEI